MRTIAELVAARSTTRAPDRSLKTDRGRGRRSLMSAQCEPRCWVRPAALSAPFHVGCCSTTFPSTRLPLGGAALAGAAVVGINPTRRGAELAHDIRHTDCGLVVTEAAHRPLLDGLDLGIDDDRIVTIESDTWEAWRNARGRLGPDGPPRPGNALRPDLHVGIDRRAQSRARNPGAVPRAWVSACRSGPTTCCTARCRCSTATRWRPTSCLR